MRTLIMIFAITLSAAGHAADPTFIPEVAAGLEQAIERGDARAISVGLYDNGQTAVIGFGHMRRDDSSAPRGDSVFEIGSISKVFTSLLTQVQADEDLLDWDEAIGDRLPDTDFASDAVASITLRELATHTSGLPRLPDNMDPADPLNPYKGYERFQLLLYLAGFEPETLVKEYDYSNLGAGVLGVLAGDAAGGGYAQAIERDVLHPLGMEDSGVRLRKDQVDRLAHGFSAGADMPNWDGFDALAGAGALLSTVDDQLRFIRQNLDPQILREPLEAIRVPQAGGRTAFGWHILDIDDGGPAYWHNGGTGGYASFLAIRPDTGTGVVILATSTEYNTITELGFAQITGHVADEETTDLVKYPGSYQLAEGFVLSISIDGGRLFAQATGQGAFPLTPSAENEFVFPAADVRIVFELADGGRAEKLTLHQGGQVLPAPRVADDQGPQSREEITLTAAQLNDYVGEFQLTPAAVISVVARNRQLYAQLTGQAAFPVFAYEPDKFFYKVVDAQLHFERGENGPVIAVVLHQGGEQRAPRVD